EPYVVHILHPRATKGAALAEYCRLRGIERRETIAFGDSLNDFSLLSYAGLGVAVADSEPRLRLVADKVMEPHETLADVLGMVVLNGCRPSRVRRSAPRNSLAASCAGLQDG